jgi:hypothetical protein
MFTLENVRTVVQKKGYAWFSSDKDYDLNIVGIRNMNFGRKVTNLFDDWLTLSYKINGEWKFHQWSITTDPGSKAVLNFGNPRGVARLIPNQYRGAYTIRLHGGKYEAVCQKDPVKVWRDKNKNMTFEEVEVQEGIFGINIHRSNPTTESQFVNDWSEGCQVFKRVKDFNEFMDICRKARVIHGNAFTYTLLTTQDFGWTPNII